MYSEWSQIRDTILIIFFFDYVCYKKKEKKCNSIEINNKIML